MNEEQKAEFTILAEAMIEFICKSGHPHMSVVITTTTAELSEGLVGIETDKFLRG